MKTKPLELKRSAYGLVAAALTLVIGAVSLLPGFVAANGQVTSRSIQLNDSSAGATAKYNIKFSTTGVTTIGGIIVDICDDTPIIGSTTCTYPAGFNWALAPTLNVTGGMGAGWVAAGLAGGGGGNYQVLKLTNVTPQATAPGTPVNFDISGVINPTAAASHSYYARIVTFDTSANLTSQYTTTGTARAASFANQVDYGGVALSTAVPISVTAKIMETMQFCTSAAAPTAVCGGTSVPAVTLGHGSPLMLDSSAIDTQTVYSQISTNATNGYAIRMRSNNACGGLSKDGGTTCPLPAINSGGASPFLMVAGTAAFGMHATAGTQVPSGALTNSVTATYAGAGSNYAFDTTTALDNVTATYGNNVITNGSVASSVNNSYTFAATAAAVTPAGIYIANETMIATGTF